MRLEAKVAIVTGAGSGIGRGIAIRLANEGAHVVVADISEAGLQKTLSILSDAGHEARSVVADVSKVDQVDGMIQAATEAWGRVDILCNNAGVLDGITPLAEISDELWNKVQSINVSGVFYACRRAIPIMIEQGAGVIVNISSLAGMRGGRGGAAYTASKHAVLGLTRNVAWYYGRKGIRANAVCPGAIESNMHSGDEMHAEGISHFVRSGGMIPVPGTPADVAGAVAFLASEDGRYINGAELKVDSGWDA